MPGHEWLHVPRAALAASGIDHWTNPSSFSKSSEDSGAVLLKTVAHVVAIGVVNHEWCVQ